MSEPPLVLDLFAGPGGASRGFLAAGCRVLGVELDPSPLYPKGAEYLRADALEVLQLLHRMEWGVDLIYAAPPARWSKIPQLRELLVANGIPWVIENTTDAGLIEPVLLCGSQFASAFTHHRLLELAGVDLLPVARDSCRRAGPNRRRDRPAGAVVANGVARLPLEQQRARLGIDAELTQTELDQATPPVFAVHVARSVFGS